MHPRVDTYSPVMGTVLELVVQPAEAADPVAQVVLGEIARLTGVLSGHDPASELSRWRRGELDGPSADLAAVLHAAERLHRVTGGALHPATGALRRLWQRAAERGEPPDETETTRLATALAALPYRCHGGVVQRLADCADVDLDALAKGYVVDAAVQAALAALDGVHPGLGVTVNAGGDLRHGGAGARRVAIENPWRRGDNAPPLTRLTVHGQALATSGSARRGVRVGGRWFGHVLDPRTGWPAQHVVSASVLAPQTMTADAVATAVMVLDVPASLALVDRLGLACLLVGADGAVHRSPRWPQTGSDADQDQDDAGHAAEQGQPEGDPAPTPDGGLQHDPGQ